MTDLQTEFKKMKFKNLLGNIIYNMHIHEYVINEPIFKEIFKPLMVVYKNDFIKTPSTKLYIDGLPCKYRKTNKAYYAYLNEILDENQRLIYLEIFKARYEYDFDYVEKMKEEKLKLKLEKEANQPQ